MEIISGTVQDKQSYCYCRSL